MQIPKQRFTSRFKWHIISGSAFVLIAGTLFGFVAINAPHRSEARIGTVTFATINGQSTMQLSTDGNMAPLQQPQTVAQSEIIKPVDDAPARVAQLSQTLPKPKLKTNSVQTIVTPKKIVPPTPTDPSLKMYVAPTLAALGAPQAIASQPVAQWFGGWTPNVSSAVNDTVTAAANNGAAPVLVAYNIPERDCGSYSAGGANGGDAYSAWIRQFAAGIGQRSAIVILEPDALAGMGCLDAASQRARMSLIADAVTVLKGMTGASVYIDAGNARWIGVKTMASRLEAANVGLSDGFSLNVSNFISTPESRRYGDELAQSVGKRYVIDTSRNGRGPAPNNQWCNPRGRALGERPTTNTGQTYVDAYLWIKVPGESDGSCNGGPSAGGWWADYANELLAND